MCVCTHIKMNEKLNETQEEREQNMIKLHCNKQQFNTGAAVVVVAVQYQQ